jgi:hypothetical protein
MPNDILNSLLAVVADAIAAPLDAALMSQDAMRARRDEYRERVAEAAMPVLVAASEAFVEAQKARFEDWLVHPRLGHGALIDEGRLADNLLQQAVADHQAKPSAATWAAVTLAACRVDAITRVVGEECIYLAPTQRKTRKATDKKDRRKNRRALGVRDLPTDILPAVANLAPDGPERAAAITKLATDKLNDTSGATAKLGALVRDPRHTEFIASLARGAATILAQDKQPHADCKPQTTGSSAPNADTARLNAESHSDACVARRKDREPGDRQIDCVAEENGGAQAEVIYAFVRRAPWALQPQRNGQIGLKPLDRKPEVTASFAAVGHLPAVQAELRNIFSRTTNGKDAQ